MTDYGQKMLVYLVENYRKSKKDTGENVILRRTRMDPVKLYKDYRKNSGDLSQIEAVNDAVRKYCEKGYITYEMNGFSNEIANIYLVDGMIDEIESYLHGYYGYVSKREKQAYIQRILNTYQGQAPAADVICGGLKDVLDKNGIPKEYLQTEQILKALVFIENNTEPLYLREASMLIYGSSKYLEENTLDKVCHILRKFYNKPCGNNEKLDEILQEFHIRKEKQKICVKGSAILKINGKLIDTSCFKEGIEFFSEELQSLEKVEIQADNFMTVENKTSYFRCFAENTVFFYLGGYCDRYQRKFLKMVYENNPNISYMHFGDIDAGGFYIYKNLCQITGIPFIRHKMSIEELENEGLAFYLQPLTENDRRRLRSLAEEEQFRDVVEYMLRKNVKLEQEIVSYKVYFGKSTGNCIE